MPRNAKSFIVTTWTIPALAGAIQLVTMPEGHENSGKIVGINHACPCGCGRGSWIGFKEYGFAEHWERTSDDWEHLTLTPSIGFLLQPNGGYHWHGYLKNGVFEEC